MPRKRNSILYNQEALEKAIQNSSSIKETLLRLDLRAAGGNYRSIRGAAKHFGLTLPIATGATRLQAAWAMQTIPLEQILIENSTYCARAQLKKRLIKAGLLEHHCYGCGLGPEWQGKPLSLQLEHKNGVFNDHRLWNLELLCPNCHSQTATFAGRKPRNNRRTNWWTPKPERKWSMRMAPALTQETLEAINLTAYVNGKPNWLAASHLLGVSDVAVKKRAKTIGRLLPRW